MSLLNNGPGNSLLSDGAKPLPDPMLTFHQYDPLWRLSMQVKNYIDDEDKFEWIIFKMSPGFNELRDISGKGPVWACFTDTYTRQFYWICNWYVHLKFKHVNKSHLSFKGFMVNKSLRLFHMSWFFSKINCPVSGCQVIGDAHLWLALPNAPHPGLRVPHAPFLRPWQPGKRNWTSVDLFSAIPPHSS